MSNPYWESFCKIPVPEGLLKIVKSHEKQGKFKKLLRPEEDQPWDFCGRNDAKVETPVLWSPHVKSWPIGKDSDAGRDWGQEEKGTIEDEMTGWHHQLPEFTETHVHRVSDAIQPSHPLSSPSPPAPNPSQHQRLFQWVNSSHEVAKVLEFQL